MLFVLLLLLIAGIAGVWLAVRARQAHERQRLLVSRLRKSEIYGHIYPELLRAGRRAVETVTIHPEGVSLRFLQPVGDTRTCSFEALGFDPMEQEPLHALAHAVAIDLPCLCDPNCYTLVTRHERRPNGDTWCWYEYAISTAYKDELMRNFARQREGFEL